MHNDETFNWKDDPALRWLSGYSEDAERLDQAAYRLAEQWDAEGRTTNSGSANQMLSTGWRACVTTWERFLTQADLQFLHEMGIRA